MESHLKIYKTVQKILGKNLKRCNNNIGKV